MHPAKLYIHNLAICATPHIASSAQFSMFFSPKTPQEPESADAEPIRRHSTTISMLEEEFGMREPPQATTRFGGRSKWAHFSFTPSLIFFVFRFTIQGFQA